MPTTCEIIFEENEKKVFYGGQLLKGHVELSLTNSKALRGENRVAKRSSDFDGSKPRG